MYSAPKGIFPQESAFIILSFSEYFRFLWF
jgi:hypothetical protein